MCGSSAKLETHHKTYRNVGQERQNQLVVLCDEHHEACHEFIKMWQAGIATKGWKQRSTYSITMKYVFRERKRLRLQHDRRPPP